MMVATHDVLVAGGRVGGGRSAFDARVSRLVAGEALLVALCVGFDAC
jgi:hypothetical protein